LCPIMLRVYAVKRTIFAAIRPQFHDDLHSSRWRPKTDWKIAILTIDMSYQQSFLYMPYKFGEILFSNCRLFMLKRQLFPRYGKNWHIAPNISEYPGSILTYFIDLVGIFARMIIPIFIWRSPKGRCRGNQLNFTILITVE